MWILAEIDRLGGEVDFAQFMELALYHSEHGYYTAGRSPWGRAGDYLTAPTASEWYGATCGRLLAGLAAAVGAPLRLVDLAAGDGAFLGSVVGSLGASAAGVFSAVAAVERSPARRREIAARSADAPVPIEVMDRFRAAGGGATVVHASELYDAMPVHRVEQGADGLVELTVAAVAGRLEWRRRPAPAELARYLDRHGVELVAGQIAEINLAAEPAHRRLLDDLGEGLALVLDYGYSAARLYDPRGRRRGSLATYHRHGLGTDPFDSPGERDLTAHVNLDDLRRAAETAGWSEIAEMALAEFMVRAGLGELLERRGLGIEAELDADTVAARQEVKRLLDPEGMGSDLKVLVQGRGELARAAERILSREVSRS